MGQNLDNMPEDLRKRVLGQMGQVNMGLVRKRKGPAPQDIVTPKTDLEGAVQKECLELLEAMGIVAWRMNTGALKTEKRFVRFGTPGMSDIVGLLPDGTFLGVECKRRHGGRQSDKQRAFEQQVVNSKGVYLLVHGAGELVDKLKGVMQ